VFVQSQLPDLQALDKQLNYEIALQLRHFLLYGSQGWSQPQIDCFG